MKKGYRGLSSEAARIIRQRGHDDARVFDEARVSGVAWISGKTKVSGRLKLVSGNFFSTGETR